MTTEPPSIGDKCAIVARDLIITMGEQGFTWQEVLNVTAIMQHSAGVSCRQSPEKLRDDVIGRLKALGGEAAP